MKADGRGLDGKEDWHDMGSAHQRGDCDHYWNRYVVGQSAVGGNGRYKRDSPFCNRHCARRLYRRFQLFVYFMAPDSNILSSHL